MHSTSCITGRVSRWFFFQPICTCRCICSNSPLTSDTSTDVTSWSAKPFDSTALQYIALLASELQKLLRKCAKNGGWTAVSVCRSNGTLWVMSKATKRKHVTREVLEEFVEPTREQQIVKVSWATALTCTVESCIRFDSQWFEWLWAYALPWGYESFIMFNVRLSVGLGRKGKQLSRRFDAVWRPVHCQYAH